MAGELLKVREKLEVIESDYSKSQVTQWFK
jgi:hypothetical protein